jgi:AcrR family transcriptional regulator
MMAPIDGSATSVAPGGEKRRGDAVRNREAILTSAISVLADSPTASMREIALASGTGRTTLYRHFPDRDALVSAICDRVIEDAGRLTAQALAGGRDEDPVEVIADLSTDLAGIGARYRFLQQAVLGDVRLTDPAEKARRRAPLRRYLEAAQRNGHVRSDLSADWLIDVFGALIAQAGRRATHGSAVPRAELRLTMRAILIPPELPRSPSATPSPRSTS